MKQVAGSTAIVLPEFGNGVDMDDPAPSPPVQQETVSRLENAREQLLALRRQQEELERQKGELEELRRKQDEYVRGRAEMIENLNRGLVTLEREQLQAQRLAELCGRTREAFTDYLERLHAINDEEWTSGNVRAELSRALGVIENSRLEYNRALTRLDCLNPAAGQPPEPVAAAAAPDTINGTELLRYFLIGGAASAPLILAGAIAVVALLVIR
jgi:hypothetical protein